MPTNTADIRQYLTSAYSDEELTTLCADYFRDVYDNFTTGMTKTAKILLLLDHCQRREGMPNLLAALERDRPEQYRKRFGQAAAEPRAAAEPAPAAIPRGRDPRQVFISHAHEDAEFAHRLAADLQTHGWRVWIAPDSIRPGEKWVDAINRGLEECGVFLVVLTPAAVASKWVTDETNVAKEMHQEGELRFIPLGVVDCRVPPLWRVHQRILFAGRYEHGLAELLAALDPHVGRTGAEASAGASGPRTQPAKASTPEDRQPSASRPAVPRVVPVPAAQPVASLDLLTIESPIRVEFVLVPAGEFLMGSDPRVDKDASAAEQPQHRLYLPEFYIGKYPVTNEQYAAFVKATHGAVPRHWENGQIPADKKGHPVVNVTWQDAFAFCQWVSQASGKTIRLPTEAEWEKAARGDDGRIYPWGNDPPTKELCNFGNNVGGTTPVGQYPAGASLCGALDMAGNVWEWTGSLYRRYPYQPEDERNSPDDKGLRILRGGSFGHVALFVRCACRRWPSPFDRNDDRGFRVVSPGF
jgi:formylglycine-generating enzyme required for sulfatase activity